MPNRRVTMQGYGSRRTVLVRRSREGFLGWIFVNGRVGHRPLILAQLPRQSFWAVSYRRFSRSNRRHCSGGAATAIVHLGV